MMYGVAKKAVPDKDEDRFAVQTVDTVSGYAVYDGHGGASTAEFLADPALGVLPRVLKTSDPLSVTNIEDVFWEIDATVGPKLAASVTEAKAASKATIGNGNAKKPRARRASVSMNADSDASVSNGKVKNSGSTATVLLVDAREQEAVCLLSWVGDSAAIVVDMSNPKVLITQETDAHVPTRTDEGERLKLYHELYRRLTTNASTRPKHRRASNAEVFDEAELHELIAQSCIVQDLDKEGEAQDVEVRAPDVAGDQPGKGSPEKNLTTSFSEEAVADVLDVIGRHLSLEDKKECIASFIRAVERDALIGKWLPKGSKYRHNAHLINRPKEKDKNEPLVVATHLDPYSKHYRDLMNTRTICDWSKSAWVIPQPETIRFTVQKYTRVVIGSDGLWDVLSRQDVAKFVKRWRKKPAEWVAKQLLSSAEDIYWKNWDSKMLGDDTTVLVVDINRPPEEELDRLSSTCCSLM